METDGVHIQKVQDEAAAHFAKVGTGKDTGYKLFKQWEYHALTNLQEDGTVLRRQVRENAIRESKQVAARGTKAVSLSNWKELGPLAMTRGASGNNPGIGRITAIYVEPVEQEIIYIGAPGGGLWKSNTGGNSWTALGDQFENMNIWAIKADPTNTDIVYIGNSAGELHKSTDGGLSFTTTPLLNTNGVLRDLLINPNNTNEIFTAVINDGVYHTTNGGDDWTKVINADIEDLRYKPGTTTTIYACGDDFYRSTDSGTSFTKVTSGILASNRMKIAVSPDNSDCVYIVQKQATGFGYLYRSIDSGTNFTVQSARGDIDYIGAQSSRDMAITVSNTNSNEVHIGGLHMYKSMDGGLSFTKETTGSFEESENSASLSYLHADIEVLDYIDGIMYVGCDGGIYKSTDAGTSFTDLSTGLGIHQFYRLANSATNKNVIIGGSEGNGSVVRSENSNEWMQYLGGDGMDCLVDINNEDILYATFQFGGMEKSIDGGASTVPSYVRPPKKGQGLWLTPIAMDTNNSSRIYAGYADLYRHDNAGISGDWINVSENIEFNSKLSFVEVCPSNSEVIYTGTLTALYKSTDITLASPTWINLYKSPEGGNITDIAVDPYDENRIAYVTTGGFVVLSTDGGESWTRIDAGLPITSIKTIVFDRAPDKGIYVGIDGVVFYKSNQVTDWTVFSNNLPNAAITELELYYDKNVQQDSRIRVATFGRGLWESPLYDDNTIDGNTCIDGVSYPYATIEAEDFCDHFGIEIQYEDTTTTSSSSAAAAAFIHNGDYIKFNGVNFGGNGAESFEAIVASDKKRGTIEIRLDDPTGSLIGTCEVNNTGGWETWANVTCDISRGRAIGTHDIFLVFTGGDGFLFNIDSFSFTEIDICIEGADAYTTIEAENFCEQLEVEIGPDSKTIGFIENGDYIKFNSVAFGNVDTATFESKVSSLTSGGTIEIRLDAPTGYLAGTCAVNNTGSWNDWVKVNCEVNDVAGTHDVYLVFTGDDNIYLFNMDWFTFLRPSTLSTASETTSEATLHKVLLFPNPVHTTMHLQMSTAGEDVVVVITNVLGQMLSTHTFSTHHGLNLLKMNIEELSSGLYNVMILKGKTKRVKTMVIQQ